MEMKEPAGKVAIVTAAGSGIGAATARRLAREGYKIAILSSSGRGESLARELDGIGLTGSNQSNDDLQRLVDNVIQKWGRIDVLVNSAGHGPRKPILELSDDDWHTGLDIYFLSAVRPVRLVAPIMQRQKAGVIINISTAWIFEPDARFPTSVVSRSGLAAFTKIFSDVYACDNVRMNNVLPGAIDSNSPLVSEVRGERVISRRRGSSEDVAATIAFLASDDAAYITGQNIRIDGGATRSV